MNDQQVQHIINMPGGIQSCLMAIFWALIGVIFFAGPSMSSVTEHLERISQTIQRWKQ